MVKTFSQKLGPPFSGQIQVAESDTYRALTLDGRVWEVQYVNRSHVRVATLTTSEIKTRTCNSELLVEGIADPKLLELLDFLAEVTLPFAAIDYFEYWLLDHKNKQPLALIYSCSNEAQMTKFPSRADWTALPDSVMPVTKTDNEKTTNAPPVNYRLELLVAERAGINRKAAWFDRRTQSDISFPPLLIEEHWPEAGQHALCQRYINRQAPRLLMLSHLTRADRQRLEACCQPYATEVTRFCGLYPEIVDADLIRALRVEARLREVAGGDTKPATPGRRDTALRI